jgi:hypothetical protein
MIKIYACIILCILFSSTLYSSEVHKNYSRREGSVVRIENPPKIDGTPDDSCWELSEVFSNFKQYEPFGGEPSKFNTEVKMVYDNEAIYICAIMYDPHPDSIRNELGQRDADRSIIADYFNVDIGPYNDGINGFSFKLTASGVQTDINRSSGVGGRDLNWDAVWQSATLITEYGWVAELKIPFSAIRFTADGVDKWGVNFWRFIQRYGEWSSWNWADKSFGTSINYMGNMGGFSGILPPVRISVSPYLSAFFENESGSETWSRVLNGGADLKIGLSESFTLDATLVPDFKQVQYDDQVLNLTPFEVKYNEKRQFFTEGTDVFGKGNIFYSRRVGGKPSGYGEINKELEPGEEVVYNPTITRLLNATKISGRTRNGLGIGIFNSVTAMAEGEIVNEFDNSSRKYITQPLTNYNMLVLDQNLGGGSYVSLINTNVLKSGPSTGTNYTANVSAADMRYLDPSRTWSVSAVPAISQKYRSDGENEYGYSLSLSGGKTGGKFRLFGSHLSISNMYDPNDMGYLQHNNLFINEITTGYNIYEPIGRILSSLNTLSLKYEMLHTPRRYNSFEIDAESKTTFRDLSMISINAVINPLKSNDYYEPRTEGWFYSRPPSVAFSSEYSSDSRRIISLTINGAVEFFDSQNNMFRYIAGIVPTLRLNNRFVFSHKIGIDYFIDDIGYITKDSFSDIVFGERVSATIENRSSLSYIFSPLSYLELRARHYWSKADYNGNYFTLSEDGGLIKNIDYSENRDININYLNIDLVYTWRFAPGSEFSIYWKNSIYQSGNEIYKTFGENLNSMFDSPAINSFSFKILYYLDYHSLRSAFK